MKKRQTAEKLKKEKATINTSNTKVEDINKSSNQESSINSTQSPSPSNLIDFTKFLPPPTPDRPFLVSLLCSIFEPGVNSSLLIAIHFTFLSLLAVHVFLIYLTEGRDFHVWALTLINMLLYPSLLIFIQMAYKK